MIHQYQNNGYNIVLDVNSGSVHVVDESAYAVIACLEKQNPAHTAKSILTEETFQYVMKELETDGKIIDAAEVREILEALSELTEAGQLFTQDIYEDYIDEVKQRKTVVKALCLHIAHDCNLACRYCFAEEGEYHGRRALMTYAVGKKALDFLIANSGSRRNLEVDFFGGEPLMNWQVVKELVAYGREQEKLHNKRFRFTLTTNGVLLNDEVQEFVNKEMDNVVLSLDGRKEINDRMRRSETGKEVHLIVPKFQRLAESRNRKNITSAVRLQETIWILPRMWSISQISDFNRFLLSRLSGRIPIRMQFRKVICRRFLQSMTSWQNSWWIESVWARDLTSFTL